MNFHEELEKLGELFTTKNHDYSGEGGPLYNYRESARMAGITTAQGMFARLSEKHLRVSTLLNSEASGRVAESLGETLQDMAVIAVLLKMALEEEPRK